MVFIYIETKYNQPPIVNLQEYICSFDARIGKQKLRNKEDSLLALTTKRYINDNSTSDKESEI